MSYLIICGVYMVVLALTPSQFMVTHVSAQGTATCTPACTGGYSQNPSYVPISAGCNKEIIPAGTTSCSQLDLCCNAHNVCYGTCGKPRLACEISLSLCVNSTVIPSGCRIAALSVGAMFAQLDTFACNHYQNAQKGGCICA